MEPQTSIHLSTVRSVSGDLETDVKQTQRISEYENEIRKKTMQRVNAGNLNAGIFNSGVLFFGVN